MTTAEAVISLVRGLLVAVFIIAALSKASQVAEFKRAIRAYRLIPDGAVSSVAIFVIAFELAIGALLLLGAAHPVPEVAAAGLLLAFAAVIGRSLLLGSRDIPCGCFGSLASASISWKLVLRNVVLSVLALMLALPGLSSAALVPSTVIAAIGAGTGLSLWVGVSAAIRASAGPAPAMPGEG